MWKNAIFYLKTCEGHSSEEWVVQYTKWLGRFWITAVKQDNNEPYITTILLTLETSNTFRMQKTIDIMLARQCVLL